MITCTLSIMLALNIVAAYDLSERFFTEHGFTISLPKEWVNISPEELDAFATEGARNLNLHRKPHYDYGFQQKSDSTGVSIPFILIQIRVPSEITYEDLKDPRTFAKSLATQLSAFNISILPREDGTPFGQFNENRKVFVTIGQLQFPGIGPVLVFSAFQLVNGGVMVISGYCLLEDAEPFSILFLEILAHLEFDAAMQFDPAKRESEQRVDGVDDPSAPVRDMRTPFLCALAGAGIIGSVVWLLLHRRRQAAKFRNNENDEPGEKVL